MITKNQLLKTFVLLTGMIGFVACSEQNEDKDIPPQAGSVKLTVTPGKLNFKAEGGTQELRVKTTYEYYGYNFNADWISAGFKDDATYNIITVTAEPNTSSTVRTATFKVTGSNSETGVDESVNITIEQEAGSSSEAKFNIDDNGGKVEVGDLQIQFPNGTFSTNTEIKVSNLKEGQVLGKDEASPFYEVTMPVKTGGTFKVSIKSNDKSSDLVMVAHTPSCTMHSTEIGFFDTFLQPTYKDGAYEVEIPRFLNPDDETATLTIGLGHAKVFSNSGAGTRVGAGVGGQVKNVKWHYAVERSFEIDNNEKLGIIDDYMEKAIKHLFDTKIVKDETKTYDVSVKFEDRQVGDYGEFCQSMFCHELSGIYLNSKLFNGEIEHQELYQTIIHELHHYFSDEYDKRWTKAGIGKCSPWLMLIEAGGVWAEHLAEGTSASSILQNNSGKFVRGYYVDDLISGGVYDDTMDAASTWYNPLSWYWLSDRRGKAWQAHGYGMGLLFEYISNQWGIATITEIYNKMYNGGSDPYDCISSVVKEKETYFFDKVTSYYRNFLIEAALGKMKQGISYANFRLKAQRALEDGDYKYSSDCYRFGIAVNTFTIGNQYKNSAGEKSVKGKEIVIKESQDKVATDAYLIWPGSVKGTYLSELVGTISKDHDLILDEKNVNYILQGETSDNKTLLLISYTPENGDKKTSELTVSLKDADATLEIEPSYLEYGPEGGTKTVTITTNQSSSNMKYHTSDKSWISASGTLKEFKITTTANTSMETREGYIEVYAVNAAGEKIIQKKITIKQNGGSPIEGRWVYTIDYPAGSRYTKSFVWSFGRDGNYSHTEGIDAWGNSSHVGWDWSWYTRNEYGSYTVSGNKVNLKPEKNTLWDDNDDHNRNPKAGSTEPYSLGFTLSSDGKSLTIDEMTFKKE